MNPLKVGITGGIGSGKSTVCRIFEVLGIPIYYADDRAKWLMVHDPGLRHEITQLFGDEAYLPDGSLNRALLAQVAFADQTKLQALNALVHPAVARDVLHWRGQQKDVPYTLQEAALLYESGSYRLLDRMVVVTAPVELRIQRVTQRDGVDRAAVLARMARQLPEEDKVNQADYVIYNDGSRSLIKQVVAVHQQLLALIQSLPHVT